MMKLSSQKQVLLVHEKMVRSKNVTDCWLTGEKSLVFSEVLVSGDKNFLRCDVLSADLCDVPSDFGQIYFEW